MAVNLSSLAPLTTAITSVSNLLLVTPTLIGYQPQNAKSVLPSFLQQSPGVIFNYEGEQTVSLQSDITDHYVEDNSAVQDQIALKPVTITTHGFIAELNDVVPLGLRPLKLAADKLVGIGAYAPQLSVTAELAFTEAQFAYQVVANAANSVLSAISSANQNQQQKIFQKFYGWWQSRILFTIQTPWAVFQNMAIQSLRAIQGAETNVITDFELTFKEIRYASTAFVGSQKSQSPVAAIQDATPINLGTSQGTPADLSITDSITSITG